MLTGAIVGNGALIGTVHFARTTTSAFNTHDLLQLGAVCNHFSACLANLRTELVLNNLNINLLTKRELQIAHLVAKGLTNGEIGKQLWISENTVKKALKKMFLKLDVSSRTEMVMRLGFSLLLDSK